MAKRVKKEDTAETPRAPRRRASVKGTEATAQPTTAAAPDARPELAAAARTGLAATATPRGESEGRPAGETVREPAEERPGRDRIAQRAYELYQQRGFTPGRDLDDWLEAERELGRTATRRRTRGK